MKIALLGAPGAGKTDVAKALARNLNKDKVGPRWQVIDGYVEALAKRTGREYGDVAGFPHNAQIMCERWTLEAEALHKGAYTITCGTIYETLIYAAMVAFHPPANEQELVFQHTYTDVCMRFFGAMEDTTFNYDAMFYLPWENQIEHPSSWFTVVDAKIPEVLEGNYKFAIQLTGTTRKKVAHALETIRLIRDDFDVPASEIAKDVGQAV